MRPAHTRTNAVQKSQIIQHFGRPEPDEFLTMPVNGIFYDPLVSPCSSRPRKGSDSAQATPPTTPCFGAPLTPDAEGDPREDVAVVHVPPLEQRVCATVLESGACERLGSKIRMEDVVCIASWSVEEDEPTKSGAALAADRTGRVASWLF